MTTAGTWYPPSAGTGGFLSDALLLSNPPFATMTNITALLDWVLDNRHLMQNTQHLDMLDLARMLARGQIGPDKPIQAEDLAAHWGCCESNVRIRIKRLRNAGMIEYDRGWSGDPGYWFHRVGPLELAQQGGSRRAAA